MKLKISKEAARRLALAFQLLDGEMSTLPTGQEGVARTIEALGYVQIDTIAVIARAHHHTLWTRRPDYRPDMLHSLQVDDRRIFEYWGHAASYLPMADYRYYLPRMQRHRAPDDGWVSRRPEVLDLLHPVLERIRAEGPLTARDFDPPPGTKRSGWWDWKPAKSALELLFWRGELMISERRGFEKVYDLTERVLPAGVDTRLPGDDEVARFVVHRALSAHGVAAEREIVDYIHAAPKGAVSTALADMTASGEVVRLQVGEITSLYYALPATLEGVDRPGPSPSRAALLSPFDNLIIHRQRMSDLFDFAYSLECYTPVAKRRYGYFVLPILWGDRLVGRLDPKADRKARRLIVRSLAMEPGFDEFDAFLPAFVDALAAFACLNECERIVIERAAPEWLPEAADLAIHRALAAYG
ncbi:MAG: YcaQ family DNA glycosylase [Anaerolineae bacterium]|nr:YcaQ family DNA glycosylase [Anaerolineae bacterium]